jgi:hypothetical protein
VTVPAVCAAAGCDRPIPAAVFMCHRHWRMVPVQLRKPALRGFVLAQEAAVAHVRTRDPAPTPAPASAAALFGGDPL